jgi:hypothetical protein
VLKAVGWTVKLTPRGSSGTGMASVPRERSHGGDGHRAGSARQHGRLGRARPLRGAPRGGRVRSNGHGSRFAARQRRGARSDPPTSEGRASSVPQ